MEVGAYLRLTLARLGNPAIRHGNHQIATDGSQKINQRILQPLRDRTAMSLASPLLETAVAAWIVYLARSQPAFGSLWQADDPLMPFVEGAARECSADIGRFARLIVANRAVFGDGLAGDAGFANRIASISRSLLAEGVGKTLGRALHSVAENPTGAVGMREVRIQAGEEILLNDEAESTRDYGEFVAGLLKRQPGLSRRLQQVAQYLLNNPEDAAIFTIVEIARRAGVPPSAITRFAKELDFDGFAGLQAIFKQRLLGPRMSYADRLLAVNRQVPDAGARDPHDPHQVADTFIQAAIDALLRLREDVADAALKPFVDALQKAKAVHIASARGAFGVGSYTYYGLSRIGKRAFLLDNLGAMRAEQLKAMDDGDALAGHHLRRLHARNGGTGAQCPCCGPDRACDHRQRAEPGRAGRFACALRQGSAARALPQPGAGDGALPDPGDEPRVPDARDSWRIVFSRPQAGIAPSRRKTATHFSWNCLPILDDPQVGGGDEEHNQRRTGCGVRPPASGAR